MDEQTTDLPVENVKPASKNFVCSECGQKDIVSRRVLGMHRWFKHHVRGVSYHEKPAPPAAKKVDGRPKKAVKAVKSMVKQPVQQRVIVPVRSVPTMSPELVGYALGKIESVTEQVARDNGLPTQEFVARVMEYYAVLAKR